MKLSVCIPVYNFDVNNLVKDLNTQILSEGIDAEIILIDDCSEKKFVDLNKNLITNSYRFVFLDKNIGRSKIRNLFLNYTKGEYLLFLDCDGKIIDKYFIKNYLKCINEKTPDVIYGGRKVDEKPPPSEFRLRWRFAVERENHQVRLRIKSPYLDFQTNNFVVKKSVLEKNLFDETILQYGYEDLIFAMDLCQKRIKIHHIDNPIYNNDVEENPVFLEKADQSAKSLAHLIKKRKELVVQSQIKLAKIYFLLSRTGGVFVYKLIFRFAKPYIKRKLLTGNTSLRFLDVYKLGQLINYINMS